MATNRHTFLRWILTIGPRWFRGFWGQRLMGTFGLLGDSVAEGARQATRGRYVDRETPFGAMIHIGADRGRPRYPSESAEHYRRRIAGGPDNGPSVWDQHLRRTSPDGIQDMFLAAGHDVEVVEEIVGASSWTFYALRVHGHGEDPCVPHDWPLPDWGSGWAWGTKLSADICREIRDIAAADAPARSRLVDLLCPTLSAALDLDHHWRADEGVTEGATLTWTDQIGAIDLSSVGATLSSSDPSFGGRPSITAIDAMSATIATDHGDASWTLVIVLDPDDPISQPSALARAQNFAASAEVDAMLSLSTDEMGLSTIAVDEGTGAPPIDGAQCLVFAFDDSADELRVYRNGQLVGVAADYSSFSDNLIGDFSVFPGSSFGNVSEIGLRFGDPPTADEIRRIGSYAFDWYGIDNDAAPFVSPWEGFDASWTAGDPDGLGRLSLPSWMAYRCPTAETSSQQSATTVQIGYAADDPRAFSRDGVAFGLLVEPAATNRQGEQDFELWNSPGSPVVTSVSDPAGGNSAVRVEDGDSTSGVRERLEDFDELGIVPSPHTFSVWVADVTSEQVSARSAESGGEGVMAKVEFAGPTFGWSYHDKAYTGTAPTTDCEIQLIPANTDTDTGAASFWGVQVEDRLYSTSLIGADNATFVRVVCTLTIDTKRVAPFGYFDIAVTAQMLFASSEAAGDVTLIAIDDATQLRYDGSDVVLVVDGVTVETISGVSWVRDAVLSFRWRHTPGSRSIAFDGQSSSTVAAQSAIVAGSDIELFGRGGASEAVAVRSIVTKRPS